MTRKFGSCFAPEGARAKHETCPGEVVGVDGVRHVCGCECHGEREVA